MLIRQSMIKDWQKCPLLYRYKHVDGQAEEQSAASTYGSILHDCVLFLEVNQDLPGAVARFHRHWQDPSLLDPEYRIDYYLRGTNWRKYAESGPRLLKDWWSIIQWDADLTLAREYTFDVPIGDGHTLHGTVDKLALRFVPKLDSYVLLVSDYKTNRKPPTYDYLAEDLQFSAYTYATTRPEFWAGLPGGRGLDLMAQYRDLPRWGEWVQLTGPKRMDAGERTQRHFNRVAMAVNEIARSVAHNIFVPTISGDSCRYCPFRKPCGLPELDADGNLVAA